MMIKNMKFTNDAAFIRNKLWFISSRKCAELSMESQIRKEEARWAPLFPG